LPQRVILSPLANLQNLVCRERSQLGRDASLRSLAA
jgi:hypothetical protein